MHTDKNEISYRFFAAILWSLVYLGIIENFVETPQNFLFFNSLSTKEYLTLYSIINAILLLFICSLGLQVKYRKISIFLIFWFFLLESLLSMNNAGLLKVFLCFYSICYLMLHTNKQLIKGFLVRYNLFLFFMFTSCHKIYLYFTQGPYDNLLFDYFAGWYSVYINYLNSRIDAPALVLITGMIEATLGIVILFYDKKYFKHILLFLSATSLLSVHFLYFVFSFIAFSALSSNQILNPKSLFKKVSFPPLVGIFLAGAAWAQQNKSYFVFIFLSYCLFLFYLMIFHIYKSRCSEEKHSFKGNRHFLVVVAFFLVGLFFLIMGTFKVPTDFKLKLQKKFFTTNKTLYVPNKLICTFIKSGFKVRLFQSILIEEAGKNSCFLVSNNSFQLENIKKRAEKVFPNHSLTFRQYPSETERIIDVVNDFSRLPDVHSLLVLQNERIVLEEYFNGYKQSSAYSIKSVSKGILSVLVGIAIQKGYMQGLHIPFSNFVPNVPVDKQGITLYHLLNMTAGLDISDKDYYDEWVSSDNWTDYILSSDKLKGAPGSDFSYSTAYSHLIGIVLQNATKTDLFTFAQRHLFDPLDIQIQYWEKDPQGHYFGGNGIWMSPTDMAKFGSMILNEGRWRGNQIVNADWIRKITTRTLTIAEIDTDGGHYTAKNVGYGLHWWVETYKHENYYYLWGFGGQYIFIFPQFQSVVIVTSSWDKVTPQKRLREIVLNRISRF